MAQGGFDSLNPNILDYLPRPVSYLVQNLPIYQVPISLAPSLHSETVISVSVSHFATLERSFPLLQNLPRPCSLPSRVVSSCHHGIKSGIQALTFTVASVLRFFLRNKMKAKVPNTDKPATRVQVSCAEPWFQRGETSDLWSQEQRAEQHRFLILYCLVAARPVPALCSGLNCAGQVPGKRRVRPSQ